VELSEETTTAAEALARFRGDRGITASGDDAARFIVPIGPLRLSFPNPGKLRLHDLHHILSGYDNDLLGEAEVSCLELRGGGLNWIITVLCLGAIALGLLLAPRRMLRAWRAAKGVRTVYSLPHTEAEILSWSLARLRAELRIPAPAS